MRPSKHMKAGVAAAILTFGVVAGGTHAAAGPLTLESGAVAGNIPGGQANDLLDALYGVGAVTRGGYYAGAVKLTTKADLTFVFLGFEAGWDNEFLVDTDGDGAFELIFSNRKRGLPTIDGKKKSAVGDMYTVMFDPALLDRGLVPFLFNAHKGGKKGSVANGGNPPAGATAGTNFFTSFDAAPTLTAGSSLVVFLDDGGGGVDADYDDLAVRIMATPLAVPEPATAFVLVLALVGLAVVSRRASLAQPPKSRPRSR